MRTANVKKRPGYGKNVFNGYVNIHINDKDSQAIKADKTSDEENLVWLNDAVIEGYSFTYKYNEEDGAFRVTATCKNEHDPNFGYVLSSWGGNIYDATRVLRYKWEAKCPDNDWTVWLSENREFG